jgi:hypothetical protein
MERASVFSVSYIKIVRASVSVLSCREREPYLRVAKQDCCSLRVVEIEANFNAMPNALCTEG